MRAGFIVSGVGHAGLIVLAIVGIGMTRPLDATPVESIAVDLISVEEFTNIRKGTLDSEVVETETPAIVDSELPAEVAQPTGNTEENQVTPEDTAVVTPAPTQQTAPEPVPEPEPEPEPEVVPEPDPEPVVEPEPQPEPEPVVEPEPVAPEPELATPTETAEPTEVAPQPVVRTAAIDQKRAAFKEQVELDKKKRENEAAEKKKKEEEERIREAARKEDEAARLADEVANIINNEDSRGATTGEGGEASLGKETGTSARLSNSEMGALSDAMKACFSPPPGASEENASALVEVNLGRDGMVLGRPQILEMYGPATAQGTASAAVRAVQRCGQNGYTMLPAEKYDGATGWNTVKVRFNANEAM